MSEASKSPPRIENFNWSSRAGSPFIADQFEMFTSRLLSGWTQRACLANNNSSALLNVNIFYQSSFDSLIK